MRIARGRVSWVALVSIGGVAGLLLLGLQTSDAEGKPKKSKTPKANASASASASASAAVAPPKKGGRTPRNRPCNDTDSKCGGNGEACSNGVCFCMEAGYARCGTEDDFGQNCAHIAADEDNCGACGKKCKDSQMCTNSKCVEVKCDAGETSCRDGCRDLKTSDDNCGTCGHACVREAGFSCNSGKCTR